MEEKVKRQRHHFSVVVRAWWPGVEGDNNHGSYAECYVMAEEVERGNLGAMQVACEYVLRRLEAWHFERGRVIDRREVRWVIVAAQAFNRRN